MFSYFAANSIEIMQETYEKEKRKTNWIEINENKREKHAKLGESKNWKDLKKLAMFA